MTALRLQWLKLTHMFMTSNRLARTIRKNEEKADEIFEEVKNMLEHHLPLVMEFGTAEQIHSAVEWFCKKSLEYFKLGVFEEEEDIFLMLLRFEEHADDHAKKVKELYEDFVKKEKTSKNPAVNYAKLEKELQELLNEHAEEMELFKNSITEMFRFVRRTELHDHQAFIDKLKRLDTGAQLRHKLKEFKRKTRKENKLTHHEEKILHHLEAAMKKNETSPKLESEIEQAITELHKDVHDDINVMKELLANSMFVMKYVMMQFFRFDSMIDVVKDYVTRVHEAGIILDRERDKINNELLAVDEHIKHSEKDVYKVIRKFRTEVRRDTNKVS